MSAQSLDTQIRIQEWRAKEAAGQLTKEDMIAIVKELRAGRSMKVQAKAGSRAKAKAAPASGDDLLAGLE